MKITVVLAFFIGLYNGVAGLFMLECRGCYCCLWSQYKDNIAFVFYIYCRSILLGMMGNEMGIGNTMQS